MSFPHKYDPKTFVSVLKATPLPAVLKFAEPGVEPGDDHQAAYLLVLDLEGRLSWSAELTDSEEHVQTSQPDITPQVAGRLLGHLLLEAPVQDGANEVARAINDCHDASQSQTQRDMKDLAKWYALTLLRTCTSPFEAAEFLTDNFSVYKYSGKTPALSPEPTYTLSKEQALERDSHRCVVSGVADAPWAMNFSDEEAESRQIGRIAPTNAAHIIPHKLTDHSTPVKANYVLPTYPAG